MIDFHLCELHCGYFFKEGEQQLDEHHAEEPSHEKQQGIFHHQHLEKTERRSSIDHAEGKLLATVTDLSDKQADVVQQAAQDDQGTGNGKQHHMLEFHLRIGYRVVITQLREGSGYPVFQFPIVRIGNIDDHFRNLFSESFR